FSRDWSSDVCSSDLNCGYDSGHSRINTRKNRRQAARRKIAGDSTRSATGPSRRHEKGGRSRPFQRQAAYSASLKVMKLARPWRSTRMDTERLAGSSLATLAKVAAESMG